MGLDGSWVTGIVLKAEPLNEYDRRVVLLTKERGKISAFAKFARKTGNKLMAPTNPFSFGQFKLFEGRSSYNIQEAEISNYFEALRTDFESAYYGMYFLELCDFYGRENLEAKDMLILLYQSLRALSTDSIPNELIRSIFEIKIIELNGEFQEVMDVKVLNQTAAYTINYILQTPCEKLFNFNISKEAMEDLHKFSKKLCSQTFDKEFKSLEILENM